MKETTTPERPLLITLTCGIGFLFLLFSLPLFTVDNFSDYSFVAFTAIVTLGCLIGLWKMKRLALYIYFSVFIVNQFVGLFLGHWSIESSCIPIIIITITSIYHNKMN